MSMSMYAKPTNARFHYRLRLGEVYRYMTIDKQQFIVEIFDELNDPIVIDFYNSESYTEGEVKFQAKRYEQIAQAAKTIKAIWTAYAKATDQPFRDWQSLTIEQLRIALGKLKAVQIYYDGRDYPHYRTIDQIAPECHNRYMDDYEIMHRANGCTFSVIAENRQEAQKLMIAEFAKSDRHNEYLIEWLQAGKPVKRDPHARYPDMVSWPILSA